jgi:hypothetical protein
MRNLILSSIVSLILVPNAFAQMSPDSQNQKQQSNQPNLPQVKKAIVVVLENTDYDAARKQPFLNELAAKGASFSNFRGVARPSQPNYIAMTSGQTHGVRNNDNHDLDVRHIGDLLEESGKDWRVYAEGFPGNCFLGAKVGKYVRKHVPFLSYVNVQTDAERCAKVVNATEFEKDVSRGELRDFSYYVPDLNNDGHDTGVKFADQWLRKRFSSLLSDPVFMKDTLFIVTFDEGALFRRNKIFTVFLGSQVKSGIKVSTEYNHYSLLRTLEEVFQIGTLGEKDSKAQAIHEIWN